MERIADRIREARRTAGLTQQDCAIRAGLSVDTLRKIEQGVTVDPGYLTVAAILRACDAEPLGAATENGGTL